MRAEFKPIPAFAEEGPVVAIAGRKTLPGAGRTTAADVHALAFLVRDAGDHTNFRLMFEMGEGNDWINALGAITTPDHGLTITDGGLVVPAAVATLGVVLGFALRGVQFRIGLAGDGTAGGNGFVALR